MPTRRYAKMATAFAVARHLYDEGELNYRFLPVQAETLQSYLLDVPKADSDDRAILEVEGRVGTKRRRQLYPRTVSILLGVLYVLYTDTVCYAVHNRYR